MIHIWYDFETDSIFESAMEPTDFLGYESASIGFFTQHNTRVCVYLGPL